ncbi:protein of unknown function [Candidatus Nitrotoga arctica]|uniref:Uncharacterized protein n=1 Tax=Candidatus Nitrotoga arctica TaxID=453162 RepID=A0ABM8Z0J6_9PROT|nr:protein of unknown function [Candidatus Nitrotoga arctica]
MPGIRYCRHHIALDDGGGKVVYAAGEFASEDEGVPPYDLTEVVMLFVNGT